MLRKLILTGLLLISIGGLSQPAEPRFTRSEYIEKYREAAIQEMLLYGIPASITMAQGILESGDGNSPLARYANNHFGIKCHTSWNGPTFIQDDDEKNECFRKYKSADDSFRDHSLFLKNRKWYASLFELKTTDYKGWAKGLKAAGYATNPLYADLLIKLIEQHKLYELDKMAGVEPRKFHVKTKPKEIALAPERSVSTRNKIKFTTAKPGDDVKSIADAFEMNVWQIYKYNDLGKKDVIKPGDVVYLQPKKNKAEEAIHTVVVGESMYSISQFYGIKLKHLYKKNRMEWGSQPKPGDKLYLKDQAP